MSVRAAGALTLAGKVDQTSNDGFVSRGTIGSGSIPATGAGVRLMWYPRKAAFRAGEVRADDPGVWDDPLVGLYSVGLGFGAWGSGRSAIAIGEHANANGDYAIALGLGADARGESSTAIGRTVGAHGDYSTAMGNFAFADFAARGAFVYGDRSTTNDLVSFAPNSFVVRAAGGTIFYSAANLSAGVSLASGGGSWQSVSDVKRKDHFRDVDGEGVLGKIARMPIREWNYKSQPSSIRHLGPTAQDFRAAFGLGESDTTITTTDIDGVNMLAVQALERRTSELRAAMHELTAMRADVASLRRETATAKAERAELLRRLALLEASTPR